MGFCGPPRLACAEYANSEAVVEARLVQSRQFFPKDKDGDDWHVYSLETIKIYKGQIEREFRVREYNNSGRAGFGWKKGESYLLFLNRDGDGTWWLYGCGNSDSLGKADRTIEVINSLSGRNGGLIQGSISGMPLGPNKLKIRVVAKKENRNYDGKLDESGHFRIHVPPGRYRIVVFLEGWTFKKDPILSYEDPADITIENGGCAQVVFDADPKLKATS
jgi:hypothetical protein